MTKVLEYLKPKVKALGFKKDVVEGIAADIADNLDEVADDASDEDINAKIKPAVDAMIPNLKLVQRLTNQGIEEYRKKQEKANEQKSEQKPEEKPGEKPEEKPEQKPEEKPSSKTPKDENETPAWAKALIESQNKQMQQQQQIIESLQAEVKGIKAKDVNTQRRAILDDLLKDTGTFGKRTIKSYEKMTFNSDDDFNSFVSDLKDDLEQLNQERANEGLEKFGAPKVDNNGQNKQTPQVKPMSETELEELAATM